MQYRTIGDGRVELTVSKLCLGTMYMGTRTDERTSFAILDRFLEAGGSFLDTANNYGQWNGDAGESERTLGRWMASRGVTDGMIVATKVGARTLVPGDPAMGNWQGLGREAILGDAELSRRQLGKDRLDLYYAHIDDRSTPQEETVDALAELAEQGKVGLLGASNHSVWRLDRGRQLALSAGRPAYSCVQQKHSYLLPIPGPAQLNLVSADLEDYVEAEELTLLAYSPLLTGLYARPDMTPRAEYGHMANVERMRVLREVAGELGATPTQVVLAWLIASKPAVVPITGASSVQQLDEQLGAMDLLLDEATMRRLDLAGREVADPSGFIGQPVRTTR
jgi:aryl-alcohol dehydrogenase-like predicted oxidoreductase